MQSNFNQSPSENLVKFIPLASWVRMPGYDTKVIETSIDGRETIIQLWKGLFPPLIPGFGGYGAEIGLYQKYWVPGVWWPDFNYKKSMSFSLINPISNEEFFSAGPKEVWWLHKWMKPSIFKDYI